MHLLHVGLQGACRGELSRAQLASEVSILLVLEQNVRILELLLAVVTKGFEHVDASLLATHFFFPLLTKVLIIIKHLHLIGAIKNGRTSRHCDDYGHDRLRQFPPFQSNT